MALVRDGAGRPDHLTAMIENIDGRKRAEAELVHRTIHDPLTKLPNRQHFLELLAAARAGSAEQDLDVGVVFVDIDDFKHVNDSLGHEAGNELLVAVAARLRAAVRPADVVARFGGDEFLVLAERLNDARDATQARVAARELAARTLLGRWRGGQRHGQLRRRDLAGSRRGRRGSRPQGRRRDVHREAPWQQPRRRVRRVGDAGTALSA